MITIKICTLLGMVLLPSVYFFIKEQHERDSNSEKILTGFLSSLLGIGVGFSFGILLSGAILKIFVNDLYEKKVTNGKLQIVKKECKQDSCYSYFLLREQTSDNYYFSTPNKEGLIETDEIETEVIYQPLESGDPYYKVIHYIPKKNKSQFVLLFESKDYILHVPSVYYYDKDEKFK